MGGKDKGIWESMLEEGLRAGMLKRILVGECGTKREIQGIEGSAEGKKVRECGARHKQKTIVGGKIEGRAQDQEG